MAESALLVYDLCYICRLYSYMAFADMQSGKDVPICSALQKTWHIKGLHYSCFLHDMQVSQVDPSQFAGFGLKNFDQ